MPLLQCCSASDLVAEIVQRFADLAAALADALFDLARCFVRFTFRFDSFVVGQIADRLLRSAFSLLCLAARGPHRPISTPFLDLEPLYGEDARNGVLPADGPAFHVWRISNG